MSYPRRPASPYDDFPTVPQVRDYPGKQDAYAGTAGSAASPYGLADEPLPAYAASHAGAYGTPWQSAPAKKVRTTIGRLKPVLERRRPIVAVDPNARLLSALRPGLMPAAQVRAADDQGNALRVGPTRPAPLFHLRPLIAREPFGYRLLFATLAVLFSAAYLLVLLQFWAPALASVEGHAHLLSGRLLAEQRTMRYVPADPFAFVGDGWVATDNVLISDSGAAVQEYFPKYGAGLPLIYAICFRLAPDAQTATAWAHLVSPACAALAVLGTFFLARYAGGSFLGALAMLAMAASQVLLQLAHDPGPHAASLALVTWGFVFLVGWWRCGHALLGLLAGLLLGYAFTVRYADGLLGVPLIAACVFAWHWRRPFASGWRTLLPILGWALPVGALLYYNQRTMGAWTGYHLSGEMTAFDADNILHAWEPLLRQFNDAGLYFLLPLGVMGLLALCARRLPLGLVMLAWFVLPMLACAAYGWTADRAAYLPYFLSVFPVLLFGAAYLLRRVLYAPGDAGPQLIVGQDPNTGQPMHMLADAPTPLWRALASPIAAGLIVAAAVGIGAHRAVAAAADAPQSAMASIHSRSSHVAALGRFVRDRVPAGSVLFADLPVDTSNGGEGWAVHHLDVTGEYELYDATMFSARFARRVAGPWSPFLEDGSRNPLGRERYEFLHFLYEGMAEADLSAAALRIIDRALNEDREVYLLMSGGDARRFAQAHLLRNYETTTLATFHEWPAVLAADAEANVPPLSQSGEWSLVKVTREPQVAAPKALAFGRA